MRRDLKRLCSVALACLWMPASLPAQPEEAPPPNAPPPLEVVVADAMNGDAVAQFMMARMYLERDSFTNAVRWLRKAAAQNVLDAQFELGYCYTLGRGVERNMAEAVKWYQVAAERGHGEAQYNLAVCYEKGLGVGKDLNHAVAWHTKAAMSGDDHAQKALGVAYEKGLGVAVDLAEACKWYEVAAARGNVDGVRLLELLKPRLSREQLAEGRRRYEELKKSAPASVTARVTPRPATAPARPKDFLQ